MNHSTVIRIENLRIWTGGSWVKCTVKSNLLLRIHYDQLLITCEDKVLESLNTIKKLKGIIKGDILILIVNANGDEVRKIKFQIRENLIQCLQELKARFPVVSYGSTASKCKVKTKYDNIGDIFKRVLEDKGALFVSGTANLTRLERDQAQDGRLYVLSGARGSYFANLLSPAIHASPVPENFSSFVKLCLLDPMFPQLVQQTKQILDTEILNKDSSV